VKKPESAQRESHVSRNQDSRPNVGVSDVAAERFINTLKANAGKRRRVSIADCFQALYDADPFAIEVAEKRAHLLALLERAAELHVLEFSKTRDRGKPSLPRSVHLADADPPSFPVDRAWSWRSELSWAHEVSLTPYEFETLRAIQDFLRSAGTGRMLVPHRERSLELFGGEKVLDVLVKGRLFAPGRLTLDVLRCKWAPPPLAFERTGNGRVALIVENAATFHTCVAIAKRGGPIGVVGYGAGRAFVASVATFVSIEGIDEIRYAGDLDEAGLAIPAAAELTAATHGVAAIKPANSLWKLLVAHAKPQGGVAVPDDVALDLVAWLPVSLHIEAARLLTSGTRLAQEAVGAELLSSHPEWIDGLASD
jgi:hypothetical protein